MTHVTDLDDPEILEAVHEAHVAADRDGDNWVDHLPDGIDCEDRYASDPWYIGSLPDGRTVWLTREDLRGADRYAIVEPEQCSPPDPPGAHTCRLY